MEIPQSEIILVRVATHPGYLEESTEESYDKSPTRARLTCSSGFVKQNSARGDSKLDIEIHDSAIFSEEENDNVHTNSRTSLRRVDSENRTRHGNNFCNPPFAKKKSEIVYDPPPRVQWFKNAFTQMGKTDVILLKDLKWACKEYKVKRVYYNDVMHVVVVVCAHLWCHLLI